MRTVADPDVHNAPLLTRLGNERLAGDRRDGSRNAWSVGPSNGTRWQTRMNSTTPRPHTSTGGPAYGSSASGGGSCARARAPVSGSADTVAVSRRGVCTPFWSSSGAGLYCSPQRATRGDVGALLVVTRTAGESGSGAVNVAAYLKSVRMACQSRCRWRRSLL